MPRFDAPLSPSSTRSARRRRLAAPHRWQQRSSALSRYCLLVYAAIVVDASLFPFSGWRDLGLAPYDYLIAGWPARALPFDVLVNALGYVPLGFILGLALHPRVRGVAMVVATVVLCAVLSIHLEALQTYLPARVASKIDVLANVGGALFGAVAAARFAHPLLDTGRLRIWRTRLFAADASRGLVLVAIWFCALVYPDAFVLGTGGFLKAVDPQRSDALAAAVGLAIGSDPVETAIRFQIAESVVSALTLFGAGLLFMHLLRAAIGRVARFALLAAFVVATVATAIFAHAFLFDNASGWPPLTPGARIGIGSAVVALAFATLLPGRARWALAVAALLGSLALVNLYPDNPYGNPVGLLWTRGKLMNFYGLASGLNLIWPYLAIAYLLRYRDSKDRQGPRPEAGTARAAALPSL